MKNYKTRLNNGKYINIEKIEEKFYYTSKNGRKFIIDKSKVLL